MNLPRFASLGLTTGDAEEATSQRAIAEASADVVVLASEEKIGSPSPFVIGPLDIMTAMIVPKSMAASKRKLFKQLDVDLIEAPRITS